MNSKTNFGDTVKVHYTGKLTDDEIFDSSLDREPIEFTIGSGMMIEGFDQGVIGMELNEERVIQIPCEKGYGVSNPDYIIPVERTLLPPDMDAEVGMKLEMSNPQGHPIPVVVTEITETHITLDANPPLAGKDLIFDVKVVGILKAM